MKFKTVREGEQAVLFNNLGEGRLIVGPERVFLHFDRLEFLKRYTADPFQYLAVKDNLGRLVHKPGPCEMFLNPMENVSIKVCQAIKIQSNHEIVVYKACCDDKQERRIIQGPRIFIPSAEEWLHTFSWHGPHPQEEGRFIPGSNTFNQLSTMPSHFFYNVSEVRTSDENMITVKLAIFYELTDVITMLESTHDPIADMVNAVCADVISFAGPITYEHFLLHTYKLSDLNIYSQLVQRAARMGFVIQKVAYRGYEATSQMQAMHDSSIRSRTQLRLDAEVQDQQQRLADFKLRKEQARTEKRQEMEKKKEEHRHKIEELKQSHQLYIQEKEHAEGLFLQGLEREMKLEQEKIKNEDEVFYLSKLKDMGVDMTQYLLQTQPCPVQQEYRLVTKEITTV